MKKSEETTNDKEFEFGVRECAIYFFTIIITVFTVSATCFINLVGRAIFFK